MSTLHKLSHNSTVFPYMTDNQLKLPQDETQHYQRYCKLNITKGNVNSTLPKVM